METLYFDLLPLDITAYLQLFIEPYDIDSWYRIIKDCNNKKYWSHFYSYLTADWKLIVENKANIISYLDQYKKIIYTHTKQIIDDLEDIDLDQIVYLISVRKVDINSQNRFGQSLLLILTWQNKSDVVKYLLEHRADVNIKDCLKSTSLHQASRYGNLNLVKLLVEHGALINVQDISGNTPISLASMNKHWEVVKYLESLI